MATFRIKTLHALALSSTLALVMVVACESPDNPGVDIADFTSDNGVYDGTADVTASPDIPQALDDDENSDVATPDTGSFTPDTTPQDTDDFNDLTTPDVGTGPPDGEFVPPELCPNECDDGDVCTVDACHIADGCIHLAVSCTDSDPCTHDVCDPTLGCSHQPYDCDDSDPCTIDHCLGNLDCSNKPIQCDDEDACTADACVDGLCENKTISCDDTDPCTVDTCDKVKGCVPDPLGELCCLSDADCQKGDPCYVDSCVSDMCQHVFQPIGDCCETAEDCDDNNACTTDACLNGHCTLQPMSVGGCCVSVTDCDDQDLCTDESCDNAFCVHTYTCCVQDADCDDDNSCTQDFCLEEKCLHVGSDAEECCQKQVYSANFEGAADGWVFTEKTEGTGWFIVTGGKSAEGTGTLYYGNPVNLNYSTGSNPNSGVAHSPPILMPTGVKSTLEFSVYLGIEAGTYPDRLLIRVISKDEFGANTNTIIWTKKNFWTLNKWVPLKLDLSAWNGKTVVIALDFNTWDGSKNETEGVYIDNFRVESSCAPLSCDTDTACNDGLLTTLEHCSTGVCLYALNPANCFAQPDCDDKNPCTSDVCGEYQCVHTDLKYCCNEDTDCVDTLLCTTGKCQKTAATPFCSQQWNYNCCEITTAGNTLGCEDGKPCTEDVCETPGKACVHTPIVDCCLKDEDCVDTEPCTVDVCIDGGCVRPNLCCAHDDDCNDLDDLCTTEICQGGLCAYDLVDLPGCCKESIISETFDGDSKSLKFTVSASPKSGESYWHTSTKNQLSPPLGMWFGNPQTGNYVSSTGTSSGAIQNAVDLRPPLLAFTELEFQLFLENEFSMGAYPNADFDRLKVTVVLLDLKKAPVGTPKTVWDSSWGTPVWWKVGQNGAPAGAKWTPIVIDLTPYSGKLVQVKFIFDTIDGFNNTFGGPVIDDIIVRRTCSTVGPPQPPLR